MLSKVLNFVAFQLAWFACILGAGNGFPWVGVIAVFVSALIHLAVIDRRSSFAILLVAAFLIGLLSDGVLMFIGVISFPGDAQLITPVPLWMLMMWVNLAITIPFSLSWMSKRYALAAAFGFIGGPGAYYTGMKLGAVELNPDLLYSLVLIGLEWAIAMPLLMLVAARVETDSGTDGTHRPIREGFVP